MADLNIRLEVRLSPRVCRLGLAAVMLLSAAGDLASESVTLTTYYPAPSGVYVQLITTGNTWLARDGGCVGIGTTNPASLLDLTGTNPALTLNNGGSQMQVGYLGGVASVGTTGSADLRFLTASAERMRIYSSGLVAINGNGTGLTTSDGIAQMEYGGFGSGYGIAGTTSGHKFALRTSNQDRLTLDTAGSVGIGVTNPSGSLDVGPSGSNTGMIVLRQTACSSVPYANGVTSCDVGTYATLAWGVYSQYWSLGNTAVGGTGSMYCCPYGAGGSAM